MKTKISFLDLASNYRCFIKVFVKIASPLHKLTIEPILHLVMRSSPIPRLDERQMGPLFDKNLENA